MTKIPARMKRALFCKLSGISRVLLKRRIRITEIPRSEGQIGYTSEDNVIHFSVDNPFIDDLPMGEKLKFVKGIWVHETMHQILTDFNAMKVLFSEDVIRTMIYRDIFNIVEDARIENYAPQYIGGIYTEDKYDKTGRITQMSDLTFSKREMYKHSPGIDTPDAFGDYPSPLQQVLRAMVHYGDCGLIKGKFRSEEAYELFSKILPIYNECVEERSCKTVIRKSIQIAEILRPLWESNMGMVTIVADELNNLKGGDHSCEGNIIVVGIPSSGSDENNISSVNRRSTTRKIESSSCSKENTEETKTTESKEEVDSNSETPKETAEKACDESKEASSPETSAEEKGASKKTETDSSEIAQKVSDGESMSPESPSDEATLANNCESEATDGADDKKTDADSISDGSSNPSSDCQVDMSETASDSEESEDRVNGDQSQSGSGEMKGSECSATSTDFNQEDHDSSEERGSTDNTSDNEPSDDSLDMREEQETEAAPTETQPGTGEIAPEKVYFSDKQGDSSESEEYDPFDDSCEPDYEGHEFELEDIDDYEVPEEELDSIVDELEELIHRTGKENVQLEDHSIPENIDFKCGEFQNVTVMNKNVKVVSDESEKTSVYDETTEIAVYSSYDIYDEVVSAMNIMCLKSAESRTRS